MPHVTYQLMVANWSINSGDDPRTEFIELETKLSTYSPADSCRVLVYAPPAAQPGLLEQAVSEAGSALGIAAEEEAFSVQIRGNEIKPADQITVELTAGEQSTKVITAEVQSVRSSLGQTKIFGVTGMQKLVDSRLNQVYENQSLNQIVNDLASQVGIATGQIETGATYSYYVVHECKSVLAHIRELAMRDGFDVYFDTDNKLNLKKFNKSSADHTFYYGIDILDLQLMNHQPTSDHIWIYGESPASNQGTDTWHWLVKDLTPFKSEVGEGVHALAIQDGAVRTKDQADQLAISKFGAIKDQSTSGRLKILGDPTVKLADAIEIKNAPKPELNGLFKIGSVRHVLNKQSGFVTFIDFTGQGGAGTAAGLLGARGDLAGAVG